MGRVLGLDARQRPARAGAGPARVDDQRAAAGVRALRRGWLLLALLAALALGACGSDGGSGGRDDAQALLERGLATDVSSGVFGLSLESTLEGAPIEELELTVDGPFQGYGPRRPLPDLNVDVHGEIDGSIAGVDGDLRGRLVTQRDNAWVVHDGQPYVLGEDSWKRLTLGLLASGEGRTFDQAGVEPLDWVSDLELSAGETIGDTKTTEVEGRVDLGRMLAGINRTTAPAERLSAKDLARLDEVVGEADFSAMIDADGFWRRLSTSVAFELPADVRAAFGDATRAELHLELRLDEPNEPQRISPPAGEPEPIANLLHELGAPADAFGIAPPAAGS